MFSRKTFIIFGLSTIFTLFSGTACAHGVFGQRFFPATIAIDDPFAGDEFNVSIFYTESPADGGGDLWTTTLTAEWDKRITKHLQFSISPSYLSIKNPGKHPKNGFDDLTIGALYELLVVPDYETIFSINLKLTIGGTGSQIVDASSNSTLTPGILFGQGFGTLPNPVKYLRPVAISGIVDANYDTRQGHVTSVDWGVVFEYSLPYLETFVQCTRFSTVMNHLIPLIECPMSTCTDGDCSGQTTGTINPGVLVIGKYGQVGVEAIIPVNKETGKKVGGVLQLHFYLDNIFPDSVGKPLITFKD